MIETIYSSENGEGDRAKMQTTFKMPKNIRQVGKSSANKKIYVEDYVMTFIKQLTGGEFSGCKLAVLVGQSIKLDNCRNIFIFGAVEVNNADLTNEIVFSNDTWTQIYEDIKKYFSETEIVGWFIGGPGYLLEDEDKILKAHVDNFAGQDKALLTYDNMEREETFLSYENNRLCRQDGYYIYYEKNDEMQTYMIDHKQSQTSNEVNYDDRVSREIRTVLMNKKPEEAENSKSITRLMYAAGTLLAVIVLIVGAAMLGNYDQMKNMQKALDSLTKNMQETQAIFAEMENSQDVAEDKDNIAKDKDNIGKDKDNIGKGQNEDDANPSAESEDNPDFTGGEESLNVEVLPGGVEPLEEAGNQSDENDEDADPPVSGEELAEDEPEDNKSANQEPSQDKPKDTPKDAEVVKEVKYYTVESGDTLGFISYKLYKTYTKVDKIMELNNITDKNKIFAGQKLIVP